MCYSSPMAFSLSETDLTPEQQLYAAGLLRDDEHLLWAGGPVCKLPKLMLFNSIVMVAVFVFVMWQIGGSSLLGTLLQADSLAALLAGLPFLVIPSVLFIVGVGSPLWYLYRLANSFYLITDCRYVSVCKYPLLGFRLQQWTGTPLAVTAEKDGTGDIVMEYRVRKSKGNVSLNPIGLLHIPNVAQVRELTAGLLNASDAAEEEETQAPEVEPPKARTVKQGMIFLALAAVVWGYGLFSAVQTHGQLATWEKAEGVVTSMERSTHHGRRGSHTSYRARYRFEVDGIRYEGKQSVASNPPAYHRGEKLTVVYNPAHPWESDVDSSFVLYFKSFALGFAGLVLFLIGFSAWGGWTWLKELAFSRRRA